MRLFSAWLSRPGAALAAVTLAALAAPLLPGPAASAAGSAVEAEQATLSPGAGQVFPDATASAGHGLLVWSNGTATASLNAPAGGTLTVRARGDQCKGAPQMQVAVDGRLRTATAVAGTAWAQYPIPGAWAGGAHTVTIAFSNDYRDSSCDRNLRLDLLRVAPTATTSPVLAPPPGNPFTGAAGYVDPGSDARKVADARRSYDPSGAAALDKIAAGSSADWYGDWVPTSSLAAAVSSRVSTETSAGALPVLVAYAIPHRDCGATPPAANPPRTPTSSGSPSSPRGSAAARQSLWSSPMPSRCWTACPPVTRASASA